MISTAVVGVGFLGRFHAQKHKQLSDELGRDLDFEFKGVWDLDPARAKLVADELGVKAFSTLQDLAENCQAVTVATSTQTHFPVALELLTAGLHVNLEKPMTVTLEQADQLMGLAEKKNLKFSVGQSERFNPVYQRAQALAPTPQLIQITRHATYKMRGADASVVLDLMIHDLDMVLAWGAQNFTLKSAVGARVRSPSLDWCEAVLVSDSGVRVVLSASRVEPLMIRQMRVQAKNLSLSGDFGTSQLKVTRWNPDVEMAESFLIEEVPKQDHLLCETRNFLKSIINKEELIIPASQGRRALEWALKIEQECNAS